MKIIFHVGMGKTGTSSIQHALKLSQAALHQQHARYLGMWFGFIDPKFDRHTGLGPFFKRPADELRHSAVQFAAMLESQYQKEGTEIFIHSCEGVFGHAENAQPFFKELSSRVPTTIVAYFRDPHSWLPSAYTQWGLRHKTAEGPVKPYAVLAPKLIKQYRSAETWIEHFKNIFIARLYSKDVDIVRDFSEVLGLEIVSPKKRALERSEHAEALLRALFNNRYPGEARPEVFNRHVMNTDKIIPRKIGDFATELFDFSKTDSIIAENIDFFDRFKQNTGLDLVSHAHREQKIVDKDLIKDRLIDYLIEIVLQQSVRINKIENRIEELRGSDNN